jgi:hypothetical protein
VDVEDKYTQIDSVWPLKRTKSVKANEMSVLEGLGLSDVEFDELLSNVCVLVQDTKPHKLPPLVVYLSGFNKKPQVEDENITKSCPVINSDELSKTDVVEKAFEEVWAVWPQNIEYPERKERALQAFLIKSSTKSPEDVQTACLAYAKECNDPNNAIVYTKALRNFLNDEDMFEDWLYRSKTITGEPDYGKAFEVAWQMYPKFRDKETPKAKKEAAILYRRFINDSNRLEFFFAVMDYFFERRGAAYNEDSPAKVIEFTKNMNSFYKDWQRQKGIWARVSWYLVLPMKEVLEAHGIRHWMYLEGDMFYNSIAYFAKQHKKNTIETCTAVIEKLYGIMGLQPDYSLVSEIMEKVRQETSEVPKSMKLILEAE